MKKGSVWIIVIIFALIGVLAIGGYFGYKHFNKTQSQNNVPSGPPVTVVVSKDANNDYSIKYFQNNSVIAEYKLEEYLQAQKFVADMPSNGEISLRLFNFDSGERAWENSYIIKKNSVVKGVSQNPDAEIIINSKYIYEIGNGLCNAVSVASSNGDVGIDLKMSQTDFLWKYKSMMEYKGCFGL